MSKQIAIDSFKKELFVRLFKENGEKEMGIRVAAWNSIMWKLIKKRLGYTNEEMKMFRENPRNEEILSKAPYLMNKTVIAEVVESHGCNSNHKVGDQFFFDGFGNLLTELCPKRICIFALNAIVP